MLKSEVKKYLEFKNYSNFAINALESERVHQENVWNNKTTSSGGNHYDVEFLVFIQDYLTEAFHIVSRNAEPQASKDAAHNIRKITAMALASAEKNGWLEEFLSTECPKILASERTLVTSLAYLQSHLNKGFDASTESFATFTGGYTVKKCVISIFYIGMALMSQSEDYAPSR
jgi:hypothetical protein